MDNNIRHYRELAGMTQEQLAKKVGVGRSTIAGYEAGYIDPPIDKLRRIASVLHVTTDSLMDEAIRRKILDMACLRDILLKECGYVCDGTLESEGTILLIGKGNEFEFEAGDLEELDRITNSSIEYFEFEFEKFIKRLKARDE